MRKCKLDGCEGVHEARGLCNKHYLRFKYHGVTEVPHPRYTTAEQALTARTRQDGDCLIWHGARSGDGYGRMKHKGHTMGSHHVAWEIANGEVPDGMELDHLCRNRACVNVAHLEPVTHEENMRRRNSEWLAGGER